MSSIFTAESGGPFAVEVSVPSLPFTFQGAQYDGFGGLLGQGSGGDRNIAANIPRDSNYGDPNYRIDLRVARSFRLTEGFTMQVLGERFNIFNRSNFNGFNTTLFDAQATTVTTPVDTPVVLTQRNNFGFPNANGSQPDGTNARRFRLALRFRFWKSPESLESSESQESVGTPGSLGAGARGIHVAVLRFRVLSGAG